MTGTWTIRDLVPADTELLRFATLANVNWTGEQRVSVRDIDTHPALRHYCTFDPARGDLGFVAQSEVAVGVVWMLFLDSADPGYGFVADGVPELSVCVFSGYRGQGIGRGLIERALGQARRQGVARVSLSVEQDNPARGLYRRLGFAQLPHAPAGTLVVGL